MDMPIAEKVGGKPSYKDHKVTEIEIAPALSKGLYPSAAQPSGLLGETGALSEVSLAVLKGEVNTPRAWKTASLCSPHVQG